MLATSQPRLPATINTRLVVLLRLGRLILLKSWKRSPPPRVGC